MADAPELGVGMLMLDGMLKFKLAKRWDLGLFNWPEIVNEWTHDF